MPDTQSTNLIQHPEESGQLTTVETSKFLPAVRVMIEFSSPFKSKKHNDRSLVSISFAMKDSGSGSFNAVDCQEFI